MYISQQVFDCEIWQENNQIRVVYVTSKPISHPTPFMVLIVAYHVLRSMLGYTNDKQPHHYCQPMTLGIQVRLISWHKYVQ